MSAVDDVVKLFTLHGDSDYGGERVTQLEHALQAAQLAEREQASCQLIAAALLHDIGHLLHELPDDAPDCGIDDEHEISGYNYLRNSFPEAVAEPIGLHVAAKRFLCAVDPQYLARLSAPSLTSLNLQGGPMTDEEVERFRRHKYFEDAVRLRKWDDNAKAPGLETKPLSHFTKYLRLAVNEEGAT